MKGMGIKTKKTFLSFLIGMICIFLVASFSLAGCKTEAEEAAEEITEEADEEVTEEVEEEEEEEVKEEITYKEAPMLAEMVESGDLPPVEERLPINPLIVEPVSEIGQYGGNLNVGCMGATDIVTAYLPFKVEPLVKWDRNGFSIIPNVAESWTIEDDGKTYEFKLREGIKWSDGTPLTTEDIMFFYNDVLSNEELTPSAVPYFKAGGEVAVFEAVDNYTFKVKFAEPNSLFLENLAFTSGYSTLEFATNQRIFMPKHYLSQFHPNYISEDDLSDMAEESGYETWTLFFQDRASTSKNPELPVLEAWICEAPFTGATLQVSHRNPYYFKVDPEGNQLPYIDNLYLNLAENEEIITSKIISGDIDFEVGHLTLPNYGVLKENEELGGYKTLLWRALMGAQLGFWFNVNHQDEDKAALFNELDFRKAMSLAIDREQINEAAFMGLANEQQATVHQDCPYFTEGLDTYYAEFDPNQANELLDGLGLDKRDGEDYRLLSNGEKLTILIEYFPSTTFGAYDDMLEIVKNNWENVGIRTILKSIDRALYTARAGTAEIDVKTWAYGRGMHPLIQPNFIFPSQTGFYTGANDYAIWYATGGTDGVKPEGDYLKVMELYTDYVKSKNEEEKIELGKEIVKISTENLWCIGTVAFSPMPAIAGDNVGNVPEEQLHEWVLGLFGHVGVEQFYFKK